MQNTFKTINPKKQYKNNAQGTNVPNTHTQHIKKTVQGTNVTKPSNRTHSKPCIKHLRKKNRTEPIQNSARETTVPKIIQNTFKTMRKTLTKVKLFQNTFKRVRKALTYQTITQNIHKTVCKQLT